MNRRRFLGALSATVLGGIGGIGGIGGMGAPRDVLGGPPQPPTAAAAAVTSPPAGGGEVVAGAKLPPPAPIVRVALPGGGVLSKLPGNGNLLALTVDDGVNTDVVRLYTEFAKETGVRLTYFVNGIYRSWTDNLALLRPLVECGQIQLGNHTWSHPNLTTVPASRVAHEIARNDEFLKNTFGVDARPYFRPPYGKHNSAVDAVAAGLGYTATTLWSGSLSDSTVITEDYIVQMAQRAFTPQAIVIGHLNHPPVTHVYGQLRDLIRARNLRTVTFDDVFFH
ncbi:polysaccharide deacetylase family protein [Mycobacterium cookii]|uniref:polysaccharide deacetylase family protein n=1 Tax=Mycobacterium cookii TaxID=1775 RepID=UPI0013D6DD82|nr:polysaccharide deacetylase family protein [Mycobacterium cookii]MCV7329467.1 polysaccharide deacetylase family protein [Mycobacterium cookii]